MSGAVRPTEELVRSAQAWVAEDPDPQTQAEVEELLVRASAADPAAVAELADRFSGPLTFGTAGLRGALGGGPHRMNRAVVIRAAAGLVSYLYAHGAHPGDRVVIGYDARTNSDVFARDTAEVVTGAGLRALVLPRPLPTPVLAFAVRDLECVAGVMVTASHNPPQDNGYKVYLGDGSQIVPPADAEIAERIAAVGALAGIPRGDGGELVDEDLTDRYLASVTALVEDDAADISKDLGIVYTPLHGVGGVTVRRALRDAGFEDVTVVEDQFHPDPAFPTVAFPNPEEPGAMDLALATAAAREEAGHTVDLVLANDPDADRCAAAVRGPHGWQVLRGDEVGALLAYHLLAQGRSGTYATTIVSSSLLAKMARTAGQPYAETLTGFKWLGRLDGLAFAYEEALGYCVDPQHVRDKDGVSAIVVLADMAARLKVDGQTLLDVLDEIAATHGVHATDQLSVRVDDLGEITAAMDRLRAAPPTALGGLEVEHTEDLTGAGPLPPTDALRLVLADGARVVVRPSGTEPKIKSYVEVVVQVHPDDGVDAARIAAAARLDAIKTDLRAAAGL